MDDDGEDPSNFEAELALLDEVEMEMGDSGVDVGMDMAISQNFCAFKIQYILCNDKSLIKI